jgi:hypothetical protein
MEYSQRVTGRHSLTGSEMEPAVRDHEQRSYYARRAEEERARAMEATDDSARHAHFELAAEYERRARSKREGG